LSARHTYPTLTHPDEGHVNKVDVKQILSCDLNLYQTYVRLTYHYIFQFHLTDAAQQHYL
jgi:hypothetical protein